MRDGSSAAASDGGDASLGDRLKRLEVYEHTVASSQDQLAVADADGRYLVANPAYARFIGLDEADLIGRRISDVITGDAWERHVGPGFARALAGETVTFQEWRTRAGDGESRYFNVVYTPLLDHGRVRGVVGSFHDITDLHRAQERLEKLAHRDPLTGLPNRALFDRILERAIKRAARQEQRVAVMFIDLDRFKLVNDTLGHAAGDEVLNQTATRLHASLRETDSLARMGGDEFVAVLEDVDFTDGPSRVADKLMAALARPFEVGDRQPQLSCSIGIALYPDDADNPEDLLGCADKAMYQAKESGRNGWRFFTEAMTSRAEAQARLVERLRFAVEGERLEVVFQPEFDVQTGKVRAVEALARWRDPELGDVPAERFIPAAEQAGLIRHLDSQCLHQACAQFARWRAERIAPPTLCINLSRHTVNQPQFPEELQRTLSAHALPLAVLQVSVTEADIVSQPDATFDSLCRIRALGINIAIDAFGSGSLALRRLQQLDVQALKINAGLLDEADAAGDDRHLAHAIIALARAVATDVVAVGIEEQTQATLLRREAGLYGQGYLLARPDRADAITPYLRGEQPAPVPG